jgi:ATP-binding cassette subfamily F protein 2
MPPKRVNKKKAKELAAAAAKKKEREAKKKEKEEEITGGGESKKKDADDYRTATGVLHSQPRALDVKIGGFSLAAYGRELIKDTSLELTIGRRYGLIGQNGSGKSTLLKCLAAREVPIPNHIDIFLLEEEAAPSDYTALEVILADARKKSS